MGRYADIDQTNLRYSANLDDFWNYKVCYREAPPFCPPPRRVLSPFRVHGDLQACTLHQMAWVSAPPLKLAIFRKIESQVEFARASLDRG